jgi:hypothetical protein
MGLGWGHRKPPPGWPIKVGHLPVPIMAYVGNENGGKKIYSASGQKSVGAFVNNVSWDVGPNGPIIDFDGTDDYIDIPSTLANLSGDIATFVLRVRIDAYDVSGAVLFNTETGGNVWYQVATDTVCVVMANSVTVANTNFDNGEWRTLAFVSDGTNSIVYNNGIQIGTDADAVTSFASGAKSFHLGNAIGGADWDLNGAIEWAYLYDVVLNQSQIQLHEIQPYHWVQDPFPIEFMAYVAVGGHPAMKRFGGVPFVGLNNSPGTGVW